MPEKVAEAEEPALLHRSLNQHPHKVSHASGIYISLASGRTVIDACGGAAVAVLGHGNAEVAAAVAQQMSQVSYVHTLSYTTDSAEDLAHLLLDGNPHGLSKAFFVLSGSEAIDGAMKMARQYFHERGEPARRHFVSRRNGYHGNTIGAMSLSQYIARRIPYEPIMPTNVTHVSPAFAYHGQRTSETAEQYVDRLVEELEAEFLRLDPQTVVAFVGETVVGATAGCVTAPAGYWPKVRAVCDKYGILLIMDEIMSGAGRTGTFWAFEQEGVVPDIVTMGKGLGAGYAPIAAIVAHERIIDTIRHGSAAFNHGQTYQAHPVSCAAALCVQQIVRREGLVERCRDGGALLEEKLKQSMADCKYVGEIRGRGLFWALEFVQDKESKYPFDAGVNFGPRVQEAAFQLGMAVYPGHGTIDGIKGDHVLLAPPYNVVEDQLDTIVALLRKAYDVVEAEVDGSKP